MNDLNSLFDNALSSGVLGSQSRGLLSGDLGSVVVAGAAGAQLEDIEAAEVTLVTLLVDESSSIQGYGLTQAVQDGHSELVKALAASDEAEGLLLALWTFHGRRQVVHGYLPVDQAEPLTAARYQPRGNTTLYDAWCEALAANVAYAQQLRDGGAPVRSVVVVITDGEDTGSRRRATDCRKLSRDLLASEQFVLAFVGLGSNEAAFRRVAQDMGVPDDSVLVQGATPQAIRKVFHTVSRSAIRASRRRVGGSFF